MLNPPVVGHAPITDVCYVEYIEERDKEIDRLASKGAVGYTHFRQRVEPVTRGPRSPSLR